MRKSEILEGTKCPKHGTPYHEEDDAFTFASATVKKCQACQFIAMAEARERLAEKDTNEAKKQVHLKRAADFLKQASMLCGRWYVCKVDGEKQDMSELQIKYAEEAEGKQVEVLTEII